MATMRKTGTCRVHSAPRCAKRGQASDSARAAECSPVPVLRVVTKHVERSTNLGIPCYGTALLEALHLTNRNHHNLAALDEAEWQKLLALSDSTQVTLLLGHYGKPFLPELIRARIEKNSLDNAERFQRLTAAVAAIAGCFASRSVEFCVLKGFTHSPDFTPDPLLRAQGDIDLWCLPDQIEQAKEGLLTLGYHPFGKSKGRHLDPMVRETEWEWRGDYFARDLPIPVDLHFSLWDEKLEYISGPDEEALWRRSITVVNRGQSMRRLDPADTLVFAVLHFMMHLLHGDLRLQRAWEIAHFLHGRSTDAAFWLRWESLYSPQVLQMQAIAFDLGRQWFGCDLPPVAQSQIRALPEDVQLWLNRYGLSPIRGLFVPNKDEVWLNLCLVDSIGAKGRVFVRRLLPMPELRKQSGANGQQRARFLLSRSCHHLRTLRSTCFRGLEWYSARWHSGRAFLMFLLVSVLFDFGEFVFFLLYNLYLAERGFDEKLIGQVSATLTIGTFAGILAASLISRRIGLRNFVMLAVVGTAVTAAFRSLVMSRAAILGSAFSNGVFLSFWAVSMPPAVASLTSERHRTMGFSVIGSIGIGVGALAGLIGGHLPAMFRHLNAGLSLVEAKQMALLGGSALAACAIVPATFMHFAPAGGVEGRLRKYPNSPFIRAFLTALFIWTLGTGGFNPFFSVYFSKRLHASVEQVGLVSSYSQMAQVGAVLLAPAILKRTGAITGVAAMQLATAAALAMLALVRDWHLGSLLFVAYMSFQYMSEPCLLSMLMTKADQPERDGASALNFLVISLAGIVAATIAGNVISRAGYSATMIVLAGVIALSAAIFRVIVR
jgi:predicted MFS family arabinose efflux permease